MRSGPVEENTRTASALEMGLFFIIVFLVLQLSKCDTSAATLKGFTLEGMHDLLSHQLTRHITWHETFPGPMIRP